MKFSVCLVLLVTVWQASSQAPGDENARCVNQHGAYPLNTRMLMDSRNYEQLITGSGAVWQALNVDGTGSGWRSSFGPLCAAQPRSCDFRQGTPQDNWFFTQYIRYIDAREVIVNITANFQECRLNSACTQLYVDMYRYERDGVDATAARTTSNYQFVRRIEQPSGFSQQQYAASFNFTPSGNTNGFYLGFRDTGTCLNLLRLQVYYIIICPVVDPPVVCPKVGQPRQGSTVQVTCSCPANSIVTPGSSLQLTCHSDGTCDGNPSCQCKEGYREITGGCIACLPGTYRSQSDPASSCLPCPDNTITSGVAVAVCPCIEGFFRAAQENPSYKCTQPPTAVRNLKVENITSNDITIMWEDPKVVGRSDYYYIIEYSDPDDASIYHRHNKDDIKGNNYTLSNLRADTIYIIQVSVHNGVSTQDFKNACDRMVTIRARTTEGPPGPPSNVKGLCTVVLWGRPSQPNGKITGYEVQVYVPDEWYGPVRSKKETDIYHIVEDSDTSSEYNHDEFHVVVRASTAAGSGEWSNQSLGCVDRAANNECPTTEVTTIPTETCPPPPTCPPVVTCPPPPPPPTCPPVVTCPPPPTCPPVVTCPPTPPPCPTCPPVPTTPSETCPTCPTCEPPPVCNCPTTPTVTCPSCPPVVTCPTTPPTTLPSSPDTQPTMQPTTQPSTQPTTPSNTCPQPSVTPGPCTIDKVWVDDDNMAHWDPPSSSCGVRSYLVRLQYERSPCRYGSLQTKRISDPAVHQWKPDPMPSQRPLYFKVRASGSSGMGPWSNLVTLAN